MSDIDPEAMKEAASKLAIGQAVCGKSVGGTLAIVNLSGKDQFVFVMAIADEKIIRLVMDVLNSVPGKHQKFVFDTMSAMARNAIAIPLNSTEPQ